MAKAILVLNEMPKKCDYCPLYKCDYDSDYDPTCKFNDKARPSEFYNDRPDWCPLRELPDESGRDQLVTRLIDLLGQLDHVSNKLDELISEISYPEMED